MLQHVIIDCFHESALLLTFIDHLRLRRGNAVAKPTHHPEVILGSCRWIRRIIFVISNVRNSGRHCDNNKIQQAQNDSDEIRTSQAGTGMSGTSGTGLSHDLKPWSPWSPWSQDMRPNGATIVFHKACSSHWSYSICGHCEYYGYYIHLLIVVFFCIFLLPEFQTQNWLETHQSLLEVHCKTWRCNGETMKIFDHFDPFVPFDPFDHYNFDQFRSSKSSFWVSACVGAVASNSARGTRDARDAHLMGGCCWGVELHQRSSQILSDCRGFCDGKTVKHMMYMLKNW